MHAAQANNEVRRWTHLDNMKKRRPPSSARWFHLVFCALALIRAGASGYGQSPGSQRWEFNPDAVGAWSGASIGPQGTVYVTLCQANGGGVVFALDGATGTKRWEYSSSCLVSTPAIGADGSSIYV